LGVILLEPSRQSNYVPGLYATLTLYILYCAVLFVRAVPVSTSSAASAAASSGAGVPLWQLWADVAWYSLLIALDTGSDSVFSRAYLFPVLVAAFGHGFWPAVRLSVGSVLLLVAIGVVIIAYDQADHIETHWLLLRCLYQLVFSYLIALWGEAEQKSKRRLALLKDVAAISNPRFGIDRTVGLLLQRLRAFYGADLCLLVTDDGQGVPQGLKQGPLIRCARRDGLTDAEEHDSLPEDEAARLLLALPQQMAAVSVSSSSRLAWLLSGVRGAWSRVAGQPSWHAVDAETGEDTGEGLDACAQAAKYLRSSSLVTVPMKGLDGGAGRLYLSNTSATRSFGHDDLEFVLQVVEHVAPTLANVRLVDRLAADAADSERQRIARDLHDGVVQSFIGLHIGLTSLRQKAASSGAELARLAQSSSGVPPESAGSAGSAGSAESAENSGGFGEVKELINHHLHLSADIERLLTLTQEEIAHVRRYVGRLKGEEATGEGSLLPALKRFAEKFSIMTGIRVEIQGHGTLSLGDRLSAEVFQMATEALSNIRRHTGANCAEVDVTQLDRTLRLRVKNVHDKDQALTPFTPRSITERAHALGGQAWVEQDTSLDGTAFTAVSVEIPL
jgi:signal transduction histidine kinase